MPKFSEYLDKKLSKNYFQSDPVELAPKLLGKIIVRKISRGFLAGKIVETEAYRGLDDEAAHSYKGETKRTEVMFREGGYLYVYFTYGMHYCANVVCGNKGEGAAVLIRGVEPINNFEILAQNRFEKTNLSSAEIINLTNGPAKFCQAFSIAKEQNGINLLENEIFISKGESISKNQIVQTTRIGISKAVDFPWRFYIKDNLYVSRK